MNTLKNQKGVTLVELSFVLIIAGLLIAGILKGQELIANSQITSTIAQMEGIKGAVSTFTSNYGVAPGDMANAAFRITNCVGGPCPNGNGDGIINVDVGAANTIADEAGFLFAHLRADGLLSGFDGTNDARYGGAFPSASVGGGFMVGDYDTGTAIGFTGSELSENLYLLITLNVQNVGNDSGILLPVEAARIDRTLDDGLPHQGVVIAQAGDTTDCRSAINTYDESNINSVCVIAYKITR